MKNILLILLTLVTLTSYGQLNWTVKGGLNVSNANFSSNGMIGTTKSMPNFMAGVVVDIPVKTFFLQTGLNYQNKGFCFETVDTDGTDIWKESYTITYDWAEVPFTICMKMPIIKDKLLLGVNFGIFTAVGLSGKNTIEYTYNGESLFYDNQSLEWGNNGDFYRFDYGLNLGINLNYNGIVLGANYLPSRGNIAKGSQIYNTVNSFYIGYQF